jgi:murein DD-endopeptidase MepM/ murein hydrolase activator NlpD
MRVYAAILMMLACHAGPALLTPSQGRLLRAADSWRPNPPNRRVVLPVAVGKIVSPYGLRIDAVSGKPRLHKGVDFKVPVGTSVRATDAGTVVKAGWQNEKDRRKGFGMRVTIDHGGGNRSTYGHLSAVKVQVGDVVAKGELIGVSGSTGNAVGPHLHYEERYQGQAHPPTFRPAAFRAETKPGVRPNYSTAAAGRPGEQRIAKVERTERVLGAAAAGSP